jgi:hypothetical protein
MCFCSSGCHIDPRNIHFQQDIPLNASLNENNACVQAIGYYFDSNITCCILMQNNVNANNVESSFQDAVAKNNANNFIKQGVYKVGTVFNISPLYSF